MKKHKDVPHTFSGTSDEDVYVVPSDRTFYVTDIVLTNKEGSAVLFTIKHVTGTTTTLEVYVDANSTKHLKFTSPKMLVGAIKASVSAFSNGSSMSLQGYED